MKKILPAPLDSIIIELRKLYGSSRIELDFSTPFQLLIAIILSAQTTDKQVNKATPKLFQQAPTPQALAELPIEAIAECIKSLNYFQSKARHIRGCAQKILEQFHGEIPQTLELLMELPGVGIKTAKVYLSQMHNAPVIGVDTHIHRVLNRLTIVHTKSPQETDKACEGIFSDEQKRGIHHPLVLFGRYICKAQSPQCSQCPLRQMCPSARIGRE